MDLEIGNVISLCVATAAGVAAVLAPRARAAVVDHRVRRLEQSIGNFGGRLEELAEMRAQLAEVRGQLSTLAAALGRTSPALAALPAPPSQAHRRRPTQPRDQAAPEYVPPEGSEDDEER